MKFSPIVRTSEVELFSAVLFVMEIPEGASESAAAAPSGEARVVIVVSSKVAASLRGAARAEEAAVVTGAIVHGKSAQARPVYKSERKRESGE